MIRRALDHLYRREHRPQADPPRCAFENCRKPWPTAIALVPSPDGTRAYEAPVCRDHPGVSS